MMDFNELVADFAARHGVTGLTAEDSAVSLDIDGIAITLTAVGDRLAISAEIGKSPAKGRADFADILLEANLESTAFFAKTRETDTYLLVRHLPLDELDGEAFDTTLETLVNTAETWRRLLADFRPVEAGTDTDLSAFDPPGFIPV